jgi:hypothetical protein
MKVIIRKKYYKRTQKGRNPIHFHAVQHGGIGSDVHAELHIDPVLRKHKDLKRAMVTHEKHELHRWGQGYVDGHYHAKTKEPKLTRKLGGVSGFWKEIKRREIKKR